MPLFTAQWRRMTDLMHFLRIHIFHVYQINIHEYAIKIKNPPPLPDLIVSKYFHQIPSFLEQTHLQFHLFFPCSFAFHFVQISSFLPSYFCVLSPSFLTYNYCSQGRYRPCTLQVSLLGKLSFIVCKTGVRAVCVAKRLDLLVPPCSSPIQLHWFNADWGNRGEGGGAL